MALQGLPLEELAITHFVKNGTTPECLFYKTKSGCRFGGKCSFAHRQVDEQPTKRLGQNSSKRQSSDARQLGCVFQDMTPAEVYSSGRAPTCRSQSNVRNSQRLLHVITKIRDQNPFARIYLPR